MQRLKNENCSKTARRAPSGYLALKRKTIYSWKLDLLSWKPGVKLLRAEILSYGNDWSEGSRKKQGMFRRQGEIPSARLSRPGIITHWLFWSLGRHLGVCGKASVCHLGLNRYLQSQVMLWDCSCAGFRWISSLQQKSTKPGNSRSWIFTQRHNFT